MANEYLRQPRHPIAKPLPRIGMNVRRGYYDQTHPRYSDCDISVVCNCFPRPSNHTIPSMFYDGITCPHQNVAHIQPAQETQFNYPWTANSVSRRLARSEDDELSERYSLISLEDDQLRFAPNPFQHRRQSVISSIQSATPYVQQRDLRDEDLPYTAPVNNTQILANGRRTLSVQDIRVPANMSNGLPRSRQNVSPTRSRNSISNRQFTGSYVDQKSGKV